VKIALDNLSYRYPGTAGPVFHRLSMTLAAPGFHSLFGQSGIGKTTLAKIIAGMLAGFQGKIEIENGRPLLYTHNRERLPGWGSIAAHLEEVGSDRRLSDELLTLFGLRELTGCRFGQLSLGQQNRVNFLRYLLQPFDILIMDESLANVDETMRRLIITKIKEIFPDRAFLYISHNILEVAQYCRQVHVLTPAAGGARVVAVAGLDGQGDRPFDRSALDAKIAEILHAA